MPKNNRIARDLVSKYLDTEDELLIELVRINKRLADLSKMQDIWAVSLGFVHRNGKKIGCETTVPMCKIEKK